MREQARAAAPSADVLERVLRFKQLCLDVLAHDLRNPLAVARGRLELLARRDPELVRDLQLAMASLDQAAALLEDVLLFAQVEERAGQTFSPANVATLAVDVVDHLRPLAEARGVTLDLEAAPGSYAVAHPLLSHAIENLVTNAIKYSPPGRAVEVAVAPAGASCRIVVADHGPGIPLELRERLFRRFSRADQAGVAGTGLGLAIVKGIVDLHGGEARIEDTPGGGATFVLEIPASRPSSK